MHMLDKVTRSIYSKYLKNIIPYMFIFPMTHFARNVKWINCCSVTKSCPTFCDPMDWNTLGFPVFHFLPKFAQTHVHQVGDAIQPSHPLLSPSLSALNLPKYQGLFQWISSLHQVDKILELQLQYQSSSEYSGLISFSTDWFYLLDIYMIYIYIIMSLFYILI